MDILIVDDHPLTCAGLRLLLESSDAAAVVATSHTAAHAREWLEGHDPHWIFLDIRLPDDTDGRLFEWLRERGLTPRVVLMSADATEDQVRYALGAGARGFIPKSAEPTLLLDAFARIRAGEVFVPAQWRTEQPGPHLTPRQEQVYRLLLQGQSNKLIARALDLSEHTVKEYVSAILAAYGATDRLGLILKGPPRSLGMRQR